MTEARIQFLEYQKPALESGDYKLRVRQELEVKSGETYSFPGGTEYKELDFSVRGERFSLNPAAIHAVFPPAGSLGRHTDCLPHISIKRSTFPWERSAYGNEDFEPWLALFLFDEKEINAGEVKKQIVALKGLKSGSGASATFPKLGSIGSESGQADDDQLTVIDVKKSLLEKIIPTGEELKLLAHVRRRVDGDETNPETELAVVVAKRLPREGVNSTVHLVSVEERYYEWKITDGSIHYLVNTGANLSIKREGEEAELAAIPDLNGNIAKELKKGTVPKAIKTRVSAITDSATVSQEKGFDYQSAGVDDFIRLVSLKSWSFACLPTEGKNFEELVEDLTTGVLSLPEESTYDASKKYLQGGYVALPHSLRQCDRTYSWYRSPLSPHAVDGAFRSDADLPQFADALIRYHKEIGMFDHSYAVAFELGRVLALEDTLFSAALYQWKKDYNETICLELQRTEADKLRVRTPSPTGSQENQLEAKMKAWFQSLARLEEIPFNYLVPDEKMLPMESIRFFKIDQHWMECLFYGAFTIGGTLRKLSKTDQHETVNLFRGLANVTTPPLVRSGFVVRSALVSDYPDLLVDAYSARVNGSAPLTPAQIATKLTPIRTERLGPDVLFCLYEGDVQTAELYLKPEGLHFGLDEEEEPSGIKRKKELRTEYIFNSVNHHLGDMKLDDSSAATKLGGIQSHIGSLSEADNIFYYDGHDAPQADGGKFEFPVHFRSAEKKDAEKRLLDVIKMSRTINGIVTDMAKRMTGKPEHEIPKEAKTETSAQFGMYMLEGSNKGRFVCEET